MKPAHTRLCVLALATSLLPGISTGQVSLQGRAGLGLAEHRALDDGTGVRSSGVLLGGALGLQIRDRIEVWGEVRGGKLIARDAPAVEDHDMAEVGLVIGARVRPWLMLRGGPVLRSYTSALARQHWTTLQLGADTRVPLAFEGLRGLLAFHWIPIASASGLPRPNLALAARVGVEWQGRRIALSMGYSLERYDFPGSAGARRLEELSALQLRAGLQLLNP